MLIFTILLLIASIWGFIEAVDEYQKPLPQWYGLQNSNLIKGFKILHAIARFLLTIFWGFWWLIILGMIFSGKIRK